MFYIHNFMSDEETDYLMASAINPKNPYKMAPSTAATHKSWSEGGRQVGEAACACMCAPD